MEVKTMLLLLINYLLIVIGKEPVKSRSKLYIQKRTMECSRVNSYWRRERTDCGLRSLNRQYSEFGKGCFNQFVPLTRDIRRLCPLHCLNSTNDTVIVSKSPISNSKCTQFFDYGLTSKSDDIYLWRKGLCLNESVEFEVRCTFAVEPKEFVLPDKVPFTLI